METTKTIPYEIVRKQIKNLYIYVRNGKVVIKAPKRIKDQEIEDFVKSKWKWISERIQQEQEEIQEKDIQRLELVVKNKIEEYSKLLKEKPNKVRIKNLNYAWGSCSSNKNISINRKLANKKDKVIEYVVLHEMCHLKYMNHSKKFWQLVETYMPEYKEYKQLLK